MPAQTYGIVNERENQARSLVAELYEFAGTEDEKRDLSSDCREQISAFEEAIEHYTLIFLWVMDCFNIEFRVGSGEQARQIEQ
ncbi:hypothetical protein AX774_g5135 [Zancudomyces culisetae]|uniref:Uncharacterized protein n=1 Tax=Zancudomyces culisetae TaxID=1213189 RepID=A0A1R1PKK4_ZANCU|nr:hypothetical protein AX774_g5135 [Zancudomyces culisetae]|eukprot:OMH81412.1 hypothetical protein AX774_g5135 [Zancudomyces culisetae]